ncbi:MAG: DegT/DnrJ/EryC1/StrS family aminotransferase [Oscillospiraceae bacterium]|nr:DegT/DnrJ/EryC1/StrS family aminotransferase [Oscillospiraceae bacterium]
MADRKRIYLSSPHMSDEGYEREYVGQAFDSNWIAPLGENIDGFEAEFAAITGAEQAVALSSGTAAIHLALKCAGVGEGDRVICQSFTFCGSANPIIYQNAIPVFADSDYETWNICPNALETAIKKHKPKAVIAVHLYGLAADMDAIISLCDHYGVAVIEDAAEALGTLYKGRHAGTIGDYGVFSFNGNKILTTSGGGILTAHSSEMADKVRFWATQSRDPAPYYLHSQLGYNYRLSNVLAGIGRGQLKVLDDRVAKKRMIFDYYKRELCGCGDLEFMPERAWNQPNFWLSCITLGESGRVGDIIAVLEAENIESRRLWMPMHLQPYYKDHDYVGSDVSETLFNTGLCLPSDTKMTESDLSLVCGIVKEVLSR